MAAQRVLLKGLQSGGNVPLGIFQCLAADIVLRYGFLGRPRGLYVITMDAVVADFEGADTGFVSLALLQLCQPVRGVRGHLSESIQFFTKAIGHDAPLPKRHRR